MDHWNGIMGGKIWRQLCPLAFSYSDCSIPWQVSSGGIRASLKLTGKTEDCQVVFNCSVACLDAVFELWAVHSIPASLFFFFSILVLLFVKKFLWWLLFSFFSIIVFYLILIYGIVTRPLLIYLSILVILQVCNLLQGHTWYVVHNFGFMIFLHPILCCSKTMFILLFYCWLLCLAL